MNKFIENVNIYLKERHIKNNYLIMQTGWDKSKISRVLNGAKDITYSEMETLADALGQSFDFFMQDADAMKVPIGPREQIACFAGTLKEEDLNAAHKLVELFQFYDSLTSFDL